MKILFFFISIIFFSLNIYAHTGSLNYSQKINRISHSLLAETKSDRAMETDIMKNSELSNQKKEAIAFIRNHVIAQKYDIAKEALSQHGYRLSKNGGWNKGRIVILLDISNDIINQAIIKPANSLI